MLNIAQDKRMLTSFSTTVFRAIYKSWHCSRHSSRAGTPFSACLSIDRIWDFSCRISLRLAYGNFYF